ncbi:hypothetical protein CORT_0D06320 [Candida orthopsilosis Co 90-125]|uniref:ZZ-type domain-containing protein n=1 Tax=Candida orthopsilosis (strain 90-125) TaxID=1136231 RepID=H8X5L0_CANO9|nr:hypothetical protein CORT_0D06320 [Candida orthopsilosis Co 90-125]CCG23468.1 hypothetical protein CORT_0D06320 [Candida orthopsilosis Co 90-125]
MPRSNQIVTIKINVFDGKEGTDNNDDVLVEKTVHVKKEDFLSIKSKNALAEYLNTELPGLLPKQSDCLNFTRKSKKHKCFISLDNEEDFKSLGRSLKVKNHVKLNVRVLSLPQGPPPPSCSCSSSSSSSSTTTTTTADVGSTPISSIDFAKLGDALLEATLEHFKDFFIENRHGTTGTKTNATTQKNETVTATANVASDASSATAAPTSSSFASPGNNKSPGKNGSTDEHVVVHTNIACDNCCPDDFIPLEGVRYCCLVCQNYDLCADCESKQQAEKLTYGTHSYLHPMAKIIAPDTFTRDFSNKFNVHHGMEYPDMSNPFHNTGPDDIVYDIPLSSCSVENRTRLENLLESKGFERFIKDVDGIIGRSDKYLLLLSILDANGLSFSNEKEKHQYLEECIEEYLLRKAFTESVNEQQIESDDEEVAKGDAVINLSLGSSSTKSSLQLVNKSDVAIDGGDFEIELIDTNQSKYSTTIKSAIVKPGQVKFYKLDVVPKDFVLNHSTKLSIFTPNVVMTSLRVEENEFQMKIKTKEAKKGGLEDSFVDSGTIKKDVNCIDENEVGMNEYPLSQKTDDIVVTYKIQSGSILNLELQNNSNTTFNCNDLKIEVYEQDVKVSESVIHRPHGIKPGCLTKANIILKNPITQFPLRMEFHSGDNKATCSFSGGQQQSCLTFLNNEVNANSVSSDKEMSEPVDDNVSTRSNSETQSASFHSMVLPVLARESIDLSDFIDANSGSRNNDEDQYGYEVVVMMMMMMMMMAILIRILRFFL